MEVKHVQPIYYSSWEKTWSYCCRGTPFSTMLRILNSLCRGVTCPSALAILFHAIPYIFSRLSRQWSSSSPSERPSASFCIFQLPFERPGRVCKSSWKTFLKPPSASWTSFSFLQLSSAFVSFRLQLPAASFCLFQLASGFFTPLLPSGFLA